MAYVRPIQFVVPILLLAQPLSAQWPDRIEPVACYRHAKQDLTVALGTLRLPRALAGASLRLAPGDHGLALPLLQKDSTRDDPKGESQLYRVLALRRGQTPEARLELLDATGTVLTTLAFALPTTQSQDQEPVETWLRARAWAWTPQPGAASPLAAALLASAASAYGPHLKLAPLPEARPESGNAPSLVALLGGRAAMEETLQLDRHLQAVRPKKPAPAVALAGIKGIETPAHPWARMLAAKDPAQRPAPLALAACVPLDRAMLYLPHPKEALAGLEGGASTFLQRLSSFAGQGALDTRIATRMMEDLGLGDGRGRRLIASGEVKEAVLFFPDLAFLAGTEATVVADLNRAEAADFIPGHGVHGFRTLGGEAFAARRGARIFLSTSKAELELALRLGEAKGQNSLGCSDEFAVVLGKLAPETDTQLFAYLPDGFIRALVGPRQRILQARQATARARMEGLAGAALLRHLDAPGEALTLERLSSLGYLPKDLDLTDLSLGPQGRVRHAQFGPLDRLLPLARLPLTQVSAAEAAAYETFRAGYSQYWRRYFDPIAVRLQVHPDGTRNLETVLLPLLDSSIYSPLRTWLAAGQALPQPVWARPMVAELGLRLSLPGLKENRVTARHLQGPWAPVLGSLTGVVAVGFPDSAPVIQMGGGSPATLMDAEFTRSGLVGLGALGLGAFTRPLVLALELQDPEATRKALADLNGDVLMGKPMPRELDFLASREPDGRLVLRIGLLGLVNMRFTGHVEDRWLVLSNDPSLAVPQVTGSRDGAPFSAAFAIHPGALKLGLASAFEAAMEGEQRSAFAAMSWLAPWLQLNPDVPAAQAASAQLLGIAPLLEPRSLMPFTRMEHQTFGTPSRPRLPALDPARDFGLLEGIRDGLVEMRIEDDSLRARATWTQN